ncbi:MAG TPA: NAD(P)-dependent oxidoreductase [Candidatus Saccharimonadales bacterium]|nr:NAD(P)-dependent oxidoreductase [Candidatus Saccharimonadales bacterium]
MSEILITGSSGVIGTVLCEGLQHHIRDFDLPEYDARAYDQLRERMSGCRAVVHLAWNNSEDHYRSARTDPDNYQMAQNIFQAALETGVHRVIVASSIHADMPSTYPKIPRSPYSLPEPDSPYGAAKVAIEALGRYYTQHKALGVIAVRFGWVSPNEADRPDQTKPYPLGEGWLSHGDCVDLVNSCPELPNIPNNYHILWGLSRRETSEVHDLNSQIWAPNDIYSAPLTHKKD